MSIPGQTSLNKVFRFLWVNVQCIPSYVLIIIEIHKVLTTVLAIEKNICLFSKEWTKKLETFQPFAEIT